MYPDRLLAQIYLDPIAFDGYPVAEIQAIGRTARLSDAQFKAGMAAFDQTLVQIIKTMTFDMNKWNQYTLRAIKETYVDVDYHRSFPGPATSETMRLKFDAIRVLAQRASILSPALLLPYDHDNNPEGVRYSRMNDLPTLVMWGAQDNMMPAEQVHRFANAISSGVDIRKIDRAGHLAGVDQPEIVAETIINFVRARFGIKALADIFLGYTGIWKGDERQVIDALRLEWQPGNPGNYSSSEIGEPIGQALGIVEVERILQAYGLAGVSRSFTTRRAFARRLIARDGWGEVQKRVREFYGNHTSIGQPTGPGFDLEDAQRILRARGVSMDRMTDDDIMYRSAEEILLDHGWSQDQIDAVEDSEDVFLAAMLERFQDRRFAAPQPSDVRANIGDAAAPMKIEVPKFVLKRYPTLMLRRRRKSLETKLSKAPSEKKRAKLQKEIEKIDSILSTRAAKKEAKRAVAGRDLAPLERPIDITASWWDIHRQFILLPPIRYRSRWDPQPRPTAGGLEAVMWEHVDLTIQYVEAAWRKKGEDSAVAELVRQFQDWVDLLNARGLPGKDLVPIITEHTLAAKDLIDAYLARNQEGARKAWKGLTDNAVRFKAYLAPLKDPHGDLADLFDRHLLCTREYMKLAAETNVRDSRFEYAQRVCLAYGMEFGALLDRLSNPKSAGQRAPQKVGVRWVRGVAQPPWSDTDIFLAYGYKLDSQPWMVTAVVGRIRRTYSKEAIDEAVREYYSTRRTPAVSKTLQGQSVGIKKIDAHWEAQPPWSDTDIFLAYGNQLDSRPDEVSDFAQDIRDTKSQAEIDYMVRDYYSTRTPTVSKALPTELRATRTRRRGRRRGRRRHGGVPDCCVEEAELTRPKSVGQSYWDLKHQFVALPTQHYRSAFSPEDEPQPVGTFQNLMWNQTDLAIIYVEALARPGSDDTRVGAEKDLLDQVADWEAKIAAAGLDWPKWRGLALAHALEEAQIANAIFAGNMDDKKRVWKELKQNANQVTEFFGSLGAKELAFLWMMHLRCTKLYIKLAKQLGPRRSQYEYAQRVCLAYAMEFGALLDRMTSS